MALDKESLEDSFLLSVSDSRRRRGFRGLCTPHSAGGAEHWCRGDQESLRQPPAVQDASLQAKEAEWGCGSKEENVSAAKLWDREKGPQRPAGKNSASENERTPSVRKQKSEAEKKKETVKAGFLPPGK